MAVSTSVSTYYLDLVEAVRNYYGSGSDQWVKIASGTASAKEMATILKQVPNVNTIVNQNGEIVAWEVKVDVFNKSASSITNIGSVADSNTVPATNSSSSITTLKIPSQTGNIVEGEFTEVPMTSGLTKYSDGTAQSTKASVAGASVTGAVITAATAVQLGFGITGELYEKYPDIFEDNNLQILAPQTWKEIAYSGTKFGNLIYTLFYKPTLTADDKTGQWYIPEKAFAYSALYLQNKELIVKQKSQEIPSGFPDVPDYLLPISDASDSMTIDILDKETGEFLRSYTVYDFSDDSDIDGVIAYITITKSGSTTYVGVVYRTYLTVGNPYYTFNDKTVAFKSSGKFSVKVRPIEDYVINGVASHNSIYESVTILEDDLIHAAWLLKYGTSEELPTGITQQTEATMPDLTNATSVDETLTILKSTYPDMWNNKIENKVLQEDGTAQTITYVPIPVPTGGVVTQSPSGDIITPTQPTTENITQNDNTVDVDSKNATDTQISTVTQPTTGAETGGVIDTITPDKTDNPPTEGGGDTPSVVIPTGTAEALWSVYNPTIEQVKSLGAYLWSTNFVDSLLKMFTNPMEAVISLHRIFGTPPTSGTGNIKIGYLDTGVSDVKLVSNQYFTVDCGSIDLPEYFGNVLDYNGYTNLSLYLPFIGIVNINNSDVLRSTISVKYQIDVFTGACLAQVNILRDASGGVLYQYTGNCAVRYPLSSGNYMNVFTSALQGAIYGGFGGVAGVATGALGGAIHGISNGVEYGRSGNFSGNAGAMGIKKPYLIISRPQTVIADKFNELQGYPTNTYTLLSNCKGFTKVTACHVDFVGNATQTEKTLIDRALRDGIIIN